ncbi:MAG: hypothetical protein KME26_18350 [Oscillatoria princeps RMCB-10]|nr:hypothetical protein [Oscillatoria princeps RMCB-10]
MQLIITYTTTALDLIANIPDLFASGTWSKIPQTAPRYRYLYKYLRLFGPPPAGKLLISYVKRLDGFLKLIASGSWALEPRNLVFIKNLTVWGVGLSAKSGNKVLLAYSGSRA